MAVAQSAELPHRVLKTLSPHYGQIEAAVFPAHQLCRVILKPQSPAA